MAPLIDPRNPRGPQFEAIRFGGRAKGALAVTDRHAGGSLSIPQGHDAAERKSVGSPRPDLLSRRAL